MIDSKKRLLMRLSGASTLAVAAALAGCGKKEEAPVAAAPAAAPAASGTFSTKLVLTLSPNSASTALRPWS